MVRERRYLFDVEDIVSVLYVCTQCQQETAYRVDGEYRAAMQCGSCGADLLMRQVGGALDLHDTLLTTLRQLMRLDSPRVKVRFVVPDPD